MPNRPVFPSHSIPQGKHLRMQHDFPHQRAGFLERVVFEELMCRRRLGDLEGFADEDGEFLLLKPAIDIVGAGALFSLGGIEHREAGQR